jgi:hypothetical protein
MGPNKLFQNAAVSSARFAGEEDNVCCVGVGSTFLVVPFYVKLVLQNVKLAENKGNMGLCFVSFSESMCIYVLFEKFLTEFVVCDGVGNATATVEFTFQGLEQVLKVFGEPKCLFSYLFTLHACFLALIPCLLVTLNTSELAGSVANAMGWTWKTGLGFQAVFIISGSISLKRTAIHDLDTRVTERLCVEARQEEATGHDDDQDKNAKCETRPF